MDLFFNELSLSGTKDKYEGAARIGAFVDTIVASRKMGLSRIKTDGGFMSRELVAGYTFANWMEGAEREKRQLVLGTLTSTPYIEKMVQDEEGVVEYRFGDQEAIGLGAADLFHSVAVSLSGIQTWEESPLELDTIKIEEAEDGSIQSIASTSLAFNFWHDHSLKKLHSEIEERKKYGLSTGKDFWRKKAEFTPELSYLDSAYDYMKKLSSREALLPNILRLLSDLNGYARSWRNESKAFIFRDIESTYSFSGESTATLNQFSACRTFSLPNGDSKVFAYHGKISFKSWRIHFYPSDELQKVFIGYIGPHLPTDKDPH